MDTIKAWHIAMNIVGEELKHEDDFSQIRLVKKAYQNINEGNKELAYDIINEGFNLHMIAGYKYIEMMDLLGRRGEFRSIAEENPLINL